MSALHYSTELEFLLQEFMDSQDPPKNEKAKKVCRECGEDDIDKLQKVYKKSDKRVYVLSMCKACKYTSDCKRLKDNPELHKNKLKRQSIKNRENRKSGIRVERFIYTDCKSSDKRFGREFDLTKEYIKEQIAKGCQFCGETTIRMTMDRIDNAIGHIKTNVVPACIRCNYVRRDMPYKAWLRMAKSMRAARKAGEFGDWTCEIQRGSRKLRMRTSNG